ncbi:MAG: transposase [Candidatus Kapaibacterium sp.]
MNLSDAGKIAEQCWSEIPKHFPSAAIDAFVIMPNHIHGIIILSDTDGRDAPRRVSGEEHGDRKFGPLQKNSIPLIINAYKSSVTRLCRKSGIVDFAWQERFYDHVIRGEQTFHKIRRYINDNVAQWKQDELNVQNTP